MINLDVNLTDPSSNAARTRAPRKMGSHRFPLNRLVRCSRRRSRKPCPNSESIQRISNSQSRISRANLLAQANFLLQLLGAPFPVRPFPVRPFPVCPSPVCPSPVCPFPVCPFPMTRARQQCPWGSARAPLPSIGTPPMPLTMPTGRNNHPRCGSSGRSTMPIKENSSENSWPERATTSMSPSWFGDGIPAR